MNLPSGSTIGILGAGQLGKMLAEAAAKLGYRTHVYAPDDDPIAAAVSAHFTKASYDDLPKLKAFADQVDVITLEFENVPTAPLKQITKPICPGAQVLEVSQHRVREKTLAQSLGIGTAPFHPVHDLASFLEAIRVVGAPGILKTCTLGYDGKGQWKYHGHETPELPAPGDYIYEGLVNFTKEISVIVARNAQGETQCFEPVENVHKNHILHTTTAPADIRPEITQKAMAIATKLANSLNVVGLLAVELFVTSDNSVLMNEVAPRPHNSGHWTLDGCNVSQFEQAIRAVTGMPLIAPKRLASQVVMTNLIGDDINHLEPWKKQGAHIHVYGKKETRPGRKMGHVTVLSP